MRPFTLSALLLASTASALPRDECFQRHSKDLADYTDCGSRAAVAQCLSSLTSFEPSRLESCYTAAGCSASQAARDAEYIMSRCQAYAREGELRKRFRAAMTPVQTTPAVVAAHLYARASTTPGPKKSGTECFSTTELDTTSCDVATDNGRLTTHACSPAKSTSSHCLSGWICTLDGSHQDVCMKKQSIDTGGIIVAIVFAAFFAIGLCYLTFACCRERSHHRKVAAKAEAVALARAATKKQRSNEARAPLMQQTQHSGAPNPFQDQSGPA
ncbi:hypothetical protein NOR_06358 [Metarhizium rileyi]|uniref:Transmembrane protein n=1 Tax=Metarhizium rileyi (strain RCEF 4871) TaxID=1649241 RepID=A0A162J3Z5_METRR|nr:hypothetical protein NOR_06358 [Metarhizium rileyi RCEF 4871]TWU71987.1 hypothetical protein ED733_002779 [Metarhizium rileyi]